MSASALHASQKVFARLVRLYPRGFRKEYGRQITQIFRDCSKEALSTAGLNGLIHLWLTTLPDLIKTAAQEHLKELNMNNFFSDPQSRARLAFILCLPLAGASLISLLADPNTWPIPVTPWMWLVSLLMLLVGLWLYGAPLGLSVLVGLLSVAPFAVMELVNRRNYGEEFPFALFGGLSLMGAIFAGTLLPLVRELRAGKQAKPPLASLLLRSVILIGVLIGWVSLVTDQMPCFLGVPLCD